MPDAAQRDMRWALVLFWLVPALWTVNYIVARMAPGVIGPYMLALGRWGLAALILVLISRAELWRERESIARACFVPDAVISKALIKALRRC